MKRLVTLGVLTLMAHPVSAALFTNPSLDAASHTLTVRPPAGFHFNLEAPAPVLKAGDHEIKVDKLTASEAVVTLPAGTTTVVARWFVCDDGKAICMAVREELVVDGAKVTAREAAVPAAAAHAPSGPPPTAGAVSHGFLVDRPDEALARAKKERRPLMIDFFGIWCPPCNALDETVFSRPEFERATEAFVKLKLDADREASWGLKERYLVGGYPTVVFANADGEEIDRIVGSRSLKEFIARVEDALAHQGEPRAVLEKKAAAGDTAAVRRLAAMMIERQEFTAAAKVLTDGKLEADPLFKRARVGGARVAVKEAPTDGKKAARAAYIEALKSALAGDAGTDALDWSNALADLLDEDGDTAGRRAAHQQMLAAAIALESKPDVLVREGLTRADLFQYKASALESLEDAAGAKAAFAAGAAEYEREVKEAGLSIANARGFNIERAYCLGKAGQVDEALALYKQLEAAYPSEFTFLFAHAGLLQNQKKLDEAEPLARQALGFAYGDNRLRAAERLAKIQKERGQVADARTVVDAAIAEAKAPADPFNRTHRYIKALKALRKSL